MHSRFGITNCRDLKPVYLDLTVWLGLWASRSITVSASLKTFQSEPTVSDAISREHVILWQFDPPSLPRKDGAKMGQPQASCSKAESYAKRSSRKSLMPFRMKETSRMWEFWRIERTQVSTGTLPLSSFMKFLMHRDCWRSMGRVDSNLRERG